MRIAIPGQRIPKSSVRFHASIPRCACAVSLEEIRRLVTPAMAALDEKLAALQGHVDRIASDVHRISHDLHPSTVAHLGLVPALRRLCREFSDRMQISVDFVDDGSWRCLPEEVAVALYRVSQECLANVAKHSHSPAACITLQEAADELRLTIADQGVGFDVSRIGHQRRPRPRQYPGARPE